MGLGFKLSFLAPIVCILAAASSATAAEKVIVGAYVNDIQYLDLKTHSYSVDVYYWFRWKNKKLDPASSFEFMNSYELWGHSRKNAYEHPEQLPSGEWYQVVRNQGRFSTKLILNNYPFDRQTLLVELEDPALSVADVAFELDQEPIAINPKLIVPGFVIGKPQLKVVRAEYPTRFGDPRDVKGDVAFSRVRLEIPISRPAVTYMVKLMLPILCVIFCAALMFLFNPTYVDARVGIGITALLTIVALQITLNEDLPEIDYLVFMDKVYLLAYLYVVAGLAVVVRTTWMLEKSKASLDRAIGVDRRALHFLTGGFFVVLGLMMAMSLL